MPTDRLLADHFTLPGAPGISGLSFRFILDTQDAQALQAVQLAAVSCDNAGDPGALAGVPYAPVLAEWLF